MARGTRGFTQRALQWARASVLESLRPPPFTGTCPLGRAYDLISSSTPGVSPVIFESATGRSNAKLAVVFIETSQSDSFRALRTSKDVVIQIMSVTEVAGAPVSPYGTFAWRYAEDDYFQPEVLIGDYISSLKGYNLVQGNVNSGLYAYWVPSEKDTPSFETFSSEIAVGDTYAFTLNWNEGDTFDSSDSNTAHQLIPCAGRGTCDSDSGKCSCLPGYTGEACQRSACVEGADSCTHLRWCPLDVLTLSHPPAAVCPNQCSGHGSCQTQLRFASDGLAVNAQAYTAYDSNQQYGCKCDAGYRGPDCSQSEWETARILRHVCAIGWLVILTPPPSCPPSQLSAPRALTSWAQMVVLRAWTAPGAVCATTPRASVSASGGTSASAASRRARSYKRLREWGKWEGCSACHARLRGGRGGAIGYAQCERTWRLTLREREGDLVVVVCLQ